MPRRSRIESKRMSKAKALNREKLRAFALPIEQDRSRGDPVKTEYDEDQGRRPDRVR